MIPPCQEIADPLTALGLLGWSLTFRCDRWAAPHIFIPMLLAILASDPINAFHAAGYWELFEVLMLFLASSYFLFPGAGGAADGESLTMIFVEDWLIQGFIGALILGTLYIRLFRSPRLLRFRDLWESPRDFWFYALWFLVYNIPFALTYVLNIGGVSYGEILIVVWQPAWAWAVWRSEGAWLRRSNNGRRKWEGYSEQRRAWFWWTIPIIMVPVYTQNMFDYLFSNGVQSWLWAALAAAGLSAAHYVVHRGVIPDYFWPFKEPCRN